MDFTLEQQKVIESRNRNLLVAAAAGSGKTAVLVERIIRMITEGEKPFDVDRLLIVTFTNAAAVEMRERIGAAIEKKAEEEPQNTHLQRQLTLLHSANISTIHSFCLYVIRNYFNELDLDPDFRMGDEGELKLMRQDVMQELLEEAYAAGEQEFLDFVEAYAYGKADSGIAEMIEKLYHFSMSYPWPEEWLDANCRLDDVEHSQWMQYLLSDLRFQAAELSERLRQGIDLCMEEDGPYYYSKILEAEREQAERLTRTESYQELYKVLQALNFARMSAKKDAAVSEEKKETVKKLRENCKKALQDMKKNYAFTDPERLLATMVDIEAPITVLCGLTKEFSKKYQAVKKEKNVLDFNDLEHLALEILVAREDGMTVPTQAAIEISARFTEIMVDEYQDSNWIQEAILNSISTEREGHPNIFMVGDVKQSIYRFRQAKPEIFMQKYDTYSLEDSLYQRIDLHKNFRSRAEVLKDINHLFYQIMDKPLGGIEYDDAAALYPGATYPEGEPRDISTDICLCSPENDSFDLSGKELEARLIARKIKEMMDDETGVMVTDKKTGKLRPARYRDMVILLRNVSSWTETMLHTLANEGIPAFADSSTGYFSALEVQTALNLLRVIDNPRQDIPLASILKSPVVGFSDEELALVVASHKKKGLFHALTEYRELHADTPLGKKIETFFTRLNDYRYRSTYMELHELLLYVLKDSGYYYYAAALPSGENRQANLNMLVQKAVEFEKTSYHGLFQFVRYIDQLQKYEVDFGESSLVDENDDSVRISSIHKSKGLEFPIVIVGGIASGFNNSDSRPAMIFHDQMGIATDYVDLEQRVKYPTLMRKAFQRRLKMDNLGEELRILYVALTRAKEKLVLIGCDRYLESRLEKWQSAGLWKPTALPVTMISSAANYLDWILMCLERGGTPNMRLQVVPLESFVEEEVFSQTEKKLGKESLLSWNSEKVSNKEIRSIVEDRLSYTYPFEEETRIHSKMSVSEIKKLSYIEEAEEEQSAELIDEETEAVAEEVLLPNFMKEEVPLTGAGRGTAYHKVLELLDFTVLTDMDSIRAAVETLLATGRISKDIADCIRYGQLKTFFESSIGERMKAAAVNGALQKEKQFVMGLEANEINTEWGSDRLILIQGIIDACFEEDGEFVIVDYKTDHVAKGEENILVKRYAEQLKYYKIALEKATGKNVKECVIYSFALAKSITIGI